MTLLTQKHPTNPPTVLRASKNNLSGSQTERYFSLLYNYDDDQEILERGFAKEGLLLFTYFVRSTFKYNDNNNPSHKML
jgi:hypothetical protein